MPKEIEIKLSVEEANSSESIAQKASKFADIPIESIIHIQKLRQSLDARTNSITVLLKLLVYTKGETVENPLNVFQYKPLLPNQTCHIIGFGPAGIYAALQCLERGIKPIILERGKAVEDRIKDISAIHKKGILNSESNYCFGEGGAGTYSDGKLYTRSSKRGDVKKVLDVMIEHGADEKIGYEAHPHIGTNKLPKLIEKMRQTILLKGGEIHFNTRLIDVNIKGDQIESIVDSNGNIRVIQHLILATGHSARDIFEMLNRKKIKIEPKPFALGIRIEHQQNLIDQIQYKRKERGLYLPPSSYNLVTQVNGRGVFSFCMCPGGVICPASTEEGETVVNGWSSSARNGPYSNSGIVVQVNPEDWIQYSQYGPLAALQFQKEIEQKAYSYTQGLSAPAQRMLDFVHHKVSRDLPRSSYQLGLISVDLHQILPPFISKSLALALVDFGKKMRGYLNNDAVLVGVESRTSSPVRIPREKATFNHPEIKNLYPCGEGAGYAGGIVSAAMDGMACANAIPIK